MLSQLTDAVSTSVTARDVAHMGQLVEALSKHVMQQQDLYQRQVAAFEAAQAQKREEEERERQRREEMMRQREEEMAEGVLIARQDDADRQRALDARRAAGEEFEEDEAGADGAPAAKK